MAAFRTNIAGFFIMNPLFSPHLSPVRNSPQNNFLADTHRKIFNMVTGKFNALVTAFIPFL